MPKRRVAKYNPDTGQCFACWLSKKDKKRRRGKCLCSAQWLAKQRIREQQEIFEGSEYTDEEWSFIQAVRAFQVKEKRKFPTFSDYLRIIKSQGYTSPRWKKNGEAKTSPKTGLDNS